MSNEQSAIARGDSYVVLFSGGPNDGQTDHRIATTSGFDSTLTVLAAVDGKETMIEYTQTDVAEVGGEFHVTYTFNAADSEPIDDPEDRGDRQ